MTRRGFSTLELMVVLAISGIIAGGILTVLRRQQRFFVNASTVVEQRVSLRDATGILPGELRALAPRAGDIVAFSDSSLDMRVTIGAGIICDSLSGGGGIALAPSNTIAPLTSFTTTPQAGDVAQWFDAALANRARDSAWTSFDISAVATSNSACATSPFVDPRAVSTPRLQLRLAGLGASPAPGAFVRILRRVRYRFYRASSSDWYLGYAEWDGTAFGVVQPVSGPFASYSRVGPSGLTLRYFDGLGGEMPPGSNPTSVSRVDVIARGAKRAELSGARGAIADSQSISVVVRNR